MMVATFPVTPGPAVTGAPAATTSGGHAATHAEAVQAVIPPWSALNLYRVWPAPSAKTVPLAVCETVTVDVFRAARAELVVLGVLGLDPLVARADVDELQAEAMIEPAARAATTAPN
jgi:hypothetical protein